MGSGGLVARHVDPRGLAGVTSRASRAVGDFMTATEARPAQVVKGFVVPVIEGGNQLSLRSVGQIGARGRRSHIEDALDLRPIVAKESLILIRHRLLQCRLSPLWSRLGRYLRPSQACDRSLEQSQSRLLQGRSSELWALKRNSINRNCLVVTPP